MIHKTKRKEKRESFEKRKKKTCYNPIGNNKHNWGNEIGATPKKSCISAN